MGFKIFEDACSDADFSKVKRVAIIGAGVAGLQTARQLVEAGIECVIFEKAQDVGGVWRENYDDFGLQVPKQLYEFPGFPYPKDRDFDLFPRGPQVQSYIQSYAEAHGLIGLIRVPIFWIGKAGKLIQLLWHLEAEVIVVFTPDAAHILRLLEDDAFDASLNE